MYYFVVLGLTCVVILGSMLSEKYETRSKQRRAYTMQQLDENKQVVASTIAGMALLVIVLMLAVPLSEPIVDWWYENVRLADNTEVRPTPATPPATPPYGPSN